MITKTVYLVRHGQSADNSQPVFQSYDSPLSTLGNEQAIKLGKRLHGYMIDALVTSSQLRATETATIVGDTIQQQPEQSDLFIERVKPTSINGKPHTNKEANTTWRSWERSLYTPGLKIEDGENYDEIMHRSRQALDYLHKRPEQHIAVITHGYFIRSIAAQVLLGDSITPEAVKEFHRVSSMANTGIVTLYYADAFEEDFCWRLGTFNDAAHLAN